MMSDYPELNEVELRAVKWDTGSLLVLADGSMSRRSVVSHRMERFFKESPNRSPFALGLTHSQKSVDEMRSKIKPLYSGTDIRNIADTFHGFAAVILTTKGNHIELDRNFRCITEESDRLLFLDEMIRMSVPECAGLRSERLLPLITRLIAGDVEPGRAVQLLKQQSYSSPETLARIYQNYRQQMFEKGRLDPSGMVSALLLLYEEWPGYNKTFKSISKNICIDDLQHLTAIEYRFLKQMVDSETKSLFVQADDALMFDRWDVEGIDRMLDMQRRFGMEICLLPSSHDCPPEITATANRLISQNFKVPTAGTFDRDLNGNGNTVRMQQFDDFADELQWITSDIAKRGAASRKKCVVVSNSKAILGRIAESLKQQGVAGYLPYGRLVFESMQMNWLIAMLRLADSRNSDEHLRQACRSFYCLSGIALNIRDITTYATVENCDNLRSWTVAVLNHKGATSDLRKMVADSMVPDLVDRLDFQSFQQSAFEWLDSIADSASEYEGFSADFASERSVWLDTVTEIAKQKSGSMLSLHVLLQEFDRLTEAPVQPKNSVPCLPIHALNGREFDHVYVAGMMDGNIPGPSSIKLGDSSYAMLEERKICSSVITSAKQSLTITCSDRMDETLSYPSRFLYEMGLLEFEDTSRYETGGQKRVAMS